MRVFRSRKELPARGCGEKDLHVWAERVWGLRQGSLLKEIETVRRAVGVVIVDVRS